MKHLASLITAALVTLVSGASSASPVALMAPLSHLCPAGSGSLINQPLAGQGSGCLLSAVPWIEDEASGLDSGIDERVIDEPSHQDAPPKGMIHLVPRTRNG